MADRVLVWRWLPVVGEEPLETARGFKVLQQQRLVVSTVADAFTS